MDLRDAAKLFLMARGRGGENETEDLDALEKLLKECFVAGATLIVEHIDNKIDEIDTEFDKTMFRRIR